MFRTGWSRTGGKRRKSGFCVSCQGKKNVLAFIGIIAWLWIVAVPSDQSFSAEENSDWNMTIIESVRTAAECETLYVSEEYPEQTENAGEADTEPVSFSADADTYGKIYLTFDDGPSADVTEEILDILKENQIQATFFIVDYPQSSIPILKRMIEEGHTVGLHGLSHDYAAIYRSEEAFMENIRELHDKLLADTGYDAYVIRFPGGSSNTVSRKYCRGIMTRLTERLDEEGIMYLDWNVSSGDAEGNGISSAQLVKSVVGGLIEGGTNVVLLHDAQTKQTTAESLQEIIDQGKQQGYEFCAVSENMEVIHHKVAN